MSLILLLVAAANISVGSVVILSGVRNTQRLWFALLVGWSSVWAITNSIYFFVDTNLRLIPALASYGAAVLVVISLIGFCIELSHLKYPRFLLLSYYTIGIIIACLSVMPGVLAIETLDDFSIRTQLPMSFLYALYILTGFLFGSFILLKGYKIARHDEKTKLRLVLAGLLVAMTIGLVCNLIFPFLGNYRLAQLGPSGTILFIIASGLAMAKYRLMDVRSVAVRTVTYVLSIASLAVIYFLVAYVTSMAIFGKNFSIEDSNSALNIVLAFILAFIFQPVKQFFDQITDRIFYRNRYDISDFLIRIGRILTSTTELHVVLEGVGREIRRTLKSESSLFVVYRDHHPNELVGEGIDEHFTVGDFDIFDVVAKKGGLIIVEKLHQSTDEREQQLHELLVEKRIALVLPLISADEVIGYLLLGGHKAGVYTKQDIEALEAMANELVIAVQNARAVQAIRDLNANLEERIEAATSELLSSNEKLRQLDAAKDEFVSMASHQLRTPLTSVKGYISMVLEGDAGKISPMQKQLLEEAFVSSERMVHLIGDFLNVSRLQTGKFVLDKKLVNLADLIEEEVDGLKATAKARSLKLEYRKPSAIPSLYIDGGKIHQVIMNFIDNAIYYSIEDTAITVKLVVEEGFLVFTVSDTGIGVPKAEQAGLFTKFFRATNARRQRPDGTGIGLYLAKKVIDAHDGSMVFSSIEGKGSTFGFRLPIKKLSEIPDASENREST